MSCYAVSHNHSELSLRNSLSSSFFLVHFLQENLTVSRTTKKKEQSFFSPAFLLEVSIKY